MTPSVFTDSLHIVLNLSENVDKLVNTSLEHWSFDLQSRRPGPAFTNVDGSKVFTGQGDLELACFLSALIDRKARINFPSYKSRTGATKTEGEVRTGSPQGRILALVSNATKPSFSIRVEDQSVTTSGEHTASGFDEAGLRTYMLQDYNGKWADTWKKIEFLPATDENEFLDNNDLWDGHTVQFTHFIHPNRWTGLFGRYYVLAKVLSSRLTEEASFIKKEIARIGEAGIKLPAKVRPTSTSTETQVSIQVSTIQAKIEHPEFSGEFATYDTTMDGLRSAAQRASYLRKAKEKLQFHIRATEFAFMRHGHTDDSPNYPSWISARFEDHKIKRTMWQRLEFSKIEMTDGDGNVTKEDVALLYRTKKISTQVGESSVSSKDEVTESRPSA